MYTLYGSPGSGSAMVELALERIGQPWRLVRASSWEPDSAQEALRALNPLLQIPTLQLPEGGVISESAAILIHLGLGHPEARLLPQEPLARAAQLRGLVFIAANCYGAIGLIDYPQRVLAPDSPAARAAVQAGARLRLHQLWEQFADLAAPSPWLGGAEPGALDFMALVVSRWCGARAHLAQARPAFAALLQRLEARPEIAAVLARHWPAGA